MTKWFVREAPRASGVTLAAVVAVAAVAAVAAGSGCGNGAKHGDDHGAKHGDDHGDDHGAKHDDDHGDDHGAQHDDDHGDEHGHGDAATAITHFTDATELFVEIPALVVGQQIPIAAHVTRLRDFAALERGTLTVELTGAGGPDERFSVTDAAQPGIFRPTLEPRHPGSRTLVIRIRFPDPAGAADIDVTHELGTIPVFATAADAAEHAEAAEHADAEEAADGAISFLKEQQWRMEFATEAVEVRAIRPSFEAYATIRARADGEAHVVAPSAGRLSSGVRAPGLGARVERGDLLVSLTPRLADAGDRAALEQQVERTRIDIEQAERERERLEALLADGAVPERRVVEARFDERQARTAHETAQRRLQQARNMQSPKARGQGALQVRAPLGGTVVSIDAVPGAFVSEGANLAHIIDLSRLWIEVHVAETHAGYLDAPRGLWFEIEGLGRVFELGPEALVTTGWVVDTRTRTIPLIFNVDNAAADDNGDNGDNSQRRARLRVGMFAEAHVLTDDAHDAPAVPISAVLYEAGLPVVYVQRGGESFERRIVRLGARDSGFIEISDGLAAGERVVTQGAYAVRLAASSGQLPEHGHHH